MLDLNVKAVDVVLADKGSWIDYNDEISFCIASTSNRGYKKAVRETVRNNMKAIEEETLDEDGASELLVEIEAKFILIDWKGLLDNGKPFESTLKNKKQLLNDPSYIELRDWINEEAGKIENYRREQVKKQQTA